MTLWLAFAAACIALIALVALYYYFFDAPSIEEEEEEAIEDETSGERARVLADRRRRIEEDKIDQIENMVGDD